MRLLRIVRFRRESVLLYEVPIYIYIIFGFSDLPTRRAPAPLCDHGLEIFTRVHVRQPHSNSGSSFFLLPTVYQRAFIFISREQFSISSLADSRRIVPIHASRRSQQLILLFAILANSRSLTTVGVEPTLVVLEGDHYTTGPTGTL